MYFRYKTEQIIPYKEKVANNNRHACYNKQKLETETS